MSGTAGTYQIDIEKQLGTERWTNVYYVTAASANAATTLGGFIVTAEKQLHMTQVSFVQMRVRPMPVGSGEGTTSPLTGTGVRIGSDFLPLFNVIRVDFRVDSGRPSRKYYRAPVDDGDTTQGVLNTASRDFFQAQVNTMLANVPELVDVDGQPWISGTVHNFVGMRQLRRGSKRKATGIL
jgi:hypothetical protein